VHHIKNCNGVPVPSNPWTYIKTTGCLSRYTHRRAALPDDWPVYLNRLLTDCLFITPMSSAGDYLARRRSCVFTTGRSGNALNAWRRRRSVNEGGSDSLFVRRRRVGRRTGRHAQCWERSKFSIISHEIDSISINRIELKSNRNSINRTITSCNEWLLLLECHLWLV